MSEAERVGWGFGRMPSWEGMTNVEIRRRLAALRADRASLDRAIAALEVVAKLRLAPVVELVPRDLVAAELARVRAWELPSVAA